MVNTTASADSSAAAAATAATTAAKRGALTKPSPYAVPLEQGKTYFYCTCGESKNQPFCDGSHKGKGYTPQKFTVDESKTHYLCGCRESANLPFCDGTHRKEPGVQKYNAFLLKRNSELTLELNALKGRTRLATYVASAVGVAAIAAVAYARTR
ncbi:hypothetical protein HDU88_005690 [Geranomyces variabilis]|nr:hypothetical protein HDU88_005690 [Geranomyces variabilis]